MLIAAWHCPCNGAAPASLLRYGLRHRSNSGFAGTESAAADALCKDGYYNVRWKRQCNIFVAYTESCFRL